MLVCRERIMVFFRCFFLISLVFLVNSPQVFSSETKKASSEKCRESFLSSSIDDLELINYTIIALKAAGIVSVKDLVTKTEEELLRTLNFSNEKMVDEIKAYLSKRGLQLKTGLDDLDLGLSIHARKALASNGIDSIEELIEKTRWELLAMPKFGERRVSEVEAHLAEKGFQLSEIPKTVLDIDVLGLSDRVRSLLVFVEIDSVEKLTEKTEEDLLRISKLKRQDVDEIKTRLKERGLRLKWTLDIDSLGFSNRTKNMLVSDRIDSVEKLLERTEETLLRIPGFGEGSLTEVKARLAEKGFQLSEIIFEDDLSLSLRTRRILRRNRIRLVKDLVERTEEELLAIPQFGEESLIEVKTRLAEKGLELKGNRQIVHQVLQEVFPGLRRVYQYEGDDVVDWPSHLKRILEEEFPDITLVPFVPDSELARVLTWREEEFLKLRFGINGKRHSFEEIRQVFNTDLSRSTLRKRQKEALKKLKDLYDLSRALWLKSILPSNPDWISNPEQVEAVIRQFSPAELDLMLKRSRSLSESEELAQLFLQGRQR